MPPIPAAVSPAAASPLRWIATIFAILALTAFAFPSGLRDWLEERNASGTLALPLAIARQVEAASNALGVAPVSADLRRRFARLIGEPET